MPREMHQMSGFGTPLNLTTTPSRIEALESIRGLAALLVVLYHIPKWNPLLDVGIINNGYLMVELFFVLSGFVIYHAYAQKIGTVRDVLRFQCLRLGRLYPVHLLFLLAFVCIEVAKYVAQTRWGIVSPNSQPFRENNLMALLEHVFLVQAIGPTGNAVTFNGPAWSISVEFYTYLLFALGVLLAKRYRDGLFALLMLLSFTLLITEMTGGFVELLRCTSGFFLGCMTALMAQHGSWRVPRTVAFCLFVLLVWFVQTKAVGDHDVGIYLLTSALIFSLVRSGEGGLKRILQCGPLVWLGSVSYALYMAHWTVLWVGNQFIRVVLKKPELMIDNKSTPQMSAMETLAACGLLLLAVLLVAACVFHWVEQPMRERSRRFVRRRLSA